ncbi:protein-export chaperone SecB [Acetobacter orleanensis]|uniref:Protein-export protein SecB n=1 Tax=Acetobacter orleanensis TaxID=104099 RepID=A0A4Y3TQA0_9PROT|nr:protein-export chaperone SecB [Acetobacter orleanensis]KXV66746.1 preprotein translocase subunit SecB [Acetobacter orleanensis]PCD78772.1 preprotein translocase subunit SecB [Acetobacter orleanensis]GAN69534.1 protein translocase subunit SecB [Acetobacter orleanensis JCM 7639]GBR23473.1 protein translocase subunit SecB [Acetobacter orleanensis NRIC 0473]GEB83903.1 protein-export protein SecB [Acetobacter orleanensis]
MADQNNLMTDSVGGAASILAKPGVLMGIQYVKAVTFQVVGAPTVYALAHERPQVAIKVDVRANQIGENAPNFEVELIMQCQGQTAPGQNGEAPARLFEAALTYAGIFTLNHSTAETFEPLLLVEAPRLLFPGARNLLVTLSREAGFLPVVVQQIDFAELWRNRRAQG